MASVYACTYMYLVFIIRVEVVEVGGVPAGHVMQEERDGEIRHQKSSGEIVECKTHQIDGKVV